METKYCTGCEKDKLIDDFAWKNKKAGKKQSKCKECYRQKSNELYKTSLTRKNSIKKRNKDLGDWHTQIIRRYKEFVGCKRCKTKYKYYILDLHHLGDKDDHISVLIRRASWQTIKKEVRKCIVVCSNCHRTIHHEQRVP